MPEGFGDLLILPMWVEGQSDAKEIRFHQTEYKYASYSFCIIIHVKHTDDSYSGFPDLRNRDLSG